MDARRRYVVGALCIGPRFRVVDRRLLDPLLVLLLDLVCLLGRVNSLRLILVGLRQLQLILGIAPLHL